MLTLRACPSHYPRPPRLFSSCFHCEQLGVLRSRLVALVLSFAPCVSLLSAVATELFVFCKQCSPASIVSRSRSSMGDTVSSLLPWTRYPIVALHNAIRPPRVFVLRPRLMMRRPRSLLMHDTPTPRHFSSTTPLLAFFIATRR